MARIDEIAPDLYRISIYAPQFDLQFNHFLINEIGSFILGTSRMMAHSERRIGRGREALAARFMDRAVETGPPSMAALDAPRVAACLRALAERDRLIVLLTFYADREAADAPRRSTPSCARSGRQSNLRRSADS